MPEKSTEERLGEIHEKAREQSAGGLAYKWDEGRHPTYIYYDNETESWLIAAHVEGGWNLYRMESFPTGMELAEAWGDAEYVPVEDTPLYHGGSLDRAREGTGPVVGTKR